MGGEIMSFPATVEEFMEQYKMVDKEQIYSNGTEYVPIFRMKQWFEHLKQLPSAQQWIPVSEKPIPKGLVLVTYNDGDVDLLSQPTSYRRGDIVAWMPLPKPWRGEEDGR